MMCQKLNHNIQMSDTKKKKKTYPKASVDALAVCRKITHSLATSIQEMLAHLKRSWLSFQTHSMAHGPPNKARQGRAKRGEGELGKFIYLI